MALTRSTAMELFEEARNLRIEILTEGQKFGFKVIRQAAGVSKSRILLKNDLIFTNRDSALESLERILMVEVAEFCIGTLKMHYGDDNMTRSYVTRILGALKNSDTIETKEILPY
jgi:hypothetical protein